MATTNSDNSELNVIKISEEEYQSYIQEKFGRMSTSAVSMKVNDRTRSKDDMSSNPGSSDTDTSSASTSSSGGITTIVDSKDLFISDVMIQGNYQTLKVGNISKEKAEKLTRESKEKAEARKAEAEKAKEGRED